MALTTLGSYSASATYTATPGTGLYTDIFTFLAAHGWTSYDDVGGSPYVRVYRNANRDGTGYKYFEIRIPTVASQYMLMIIWESWNSTTHVGTNPAYHSYTNGYSRFDVGTGGGTIYLFGDSDYFAYMPEKSGVYGMTYPTAAAGGFGGIFEVETEHPDDDGSAGPPYYYIDSQMVTGNVSGGIIGAIWGTRFINGVTGLLACEDTLITCDAGFSGKPVGTGYLVSAIRNSITQYKNTTNSKYGVWDIRGGMMRAATWEIRGKIYGIKIANQLIGSVTSLTDKVSVPVNANRFNNPSGTLTDYWILPGDSNMRVLLPV